MNSFSKSKKNIISSILLCLGILLGTTSHFKLNLDDDYLWYALSSIKMAQYHNFDQDFRAAITANSKGQLFSEKKLQNPYGRSDLRNKYKYNYLGFSTVLVAAYTILGDLFNFKLNVIPNYYYLFLFSFVIFLLILGFSLVKALNGPGSSSQVIHTILACFTLSLLIRIISLNTFSYSLLSDGPFEIALFDIIEFNYRNIAQSFIFNNDVFTEYSFSPRSLFYIWSILFLVLRIYKNRYAQAFGLILSFFHNSNALILFLAIMPLDINSGKYKFNKSNILHYLTIAKILLFERVYEFDILFGATVVLAFTLLIFMAKNKWGDKLFSYINNHHYQFIYFIVLTVLGLAFIDIAAKFFQETISLSFYSLPNRLINIMKPCIITSLLYYIYTSNLYSWLRTSLYRLTLLALISTCIINAYFVKANIQENIAEIIDQKNILIKNKLTKVGDIEAKSLLDLISSYHL